MVLLKETSYNKKDTLNPREVRCTPLFNFVHLILRIIGVLSVRFLFYVNSKTDVKYIC